MFRRSQGLLGIKRRPRFWPRVGWACLILVGAAAVAAVSTTLVGAWWIERQALDKLEGLAARAGLELEVGNVIVQPGSPVAIWDLRVTDPDGDADLLGAARVSTDLTFEDLRAGRRRPGEIRLSGVTLDLSSPGRWKAALHRYLAGGEPGAESAQGRPAPRVLITQATVRLPAWGGLVAPVLSSAILRAEPPEGREDRRWKVLVSGVLNGRRHVELSALVDPAGDDGLEVGLTVTPALSMPIEGLGTVSARSLWARRGKGIRLRDVRLDLPDRGRITVAALTLTPRSGEDWLEGAATLTAHTIAIDGSGLVARVAQADLELAAGALSRPLSRARGLELRGLGLEAADALLAMTTRSATITLTQGPIDPAAPLASVTSIALNGANVSMALPPASAVGSVPYYREIQAFLLGTAPTSTGVGGGPADVRPPASPMTALAPLSIPVPNVTITEGTLALLVDDREQAAVLVEGLDASLSPAGPDGGLVGRISGKLEQLSTGEHGAFLVEAQTSPDGRLVGARIKLSGSRLAHHVAAQLSDSIRLSERSALGVDLTITPHSAGRGVSATGSVSLENMGFHAPRIHGQPVDGLKIAADLTLELNPEEHRLIIDAPTIRIDDEATLRLAATVSGLDRERPTLDVKLAVPRQSCQALIAAIPAVMVPRLEGLRVSGTAEGHLNFTVDLEKPRGYKHDLDVDMSRCRPEAFGSADVPRLNTRFVHEVVEKGHPIGVTVGPGTWHYRPLRQIPKHIQMGALWTEDHSFFRHGGFRPALIRRAVILNLEGGRYIYGGSTITQQLVKNLFLSREKTLTRKLEEAILVWLVEREVPKKRILELYLNCIEYGPSLYGLENAARAYFDKHVGELSALEGAFLMGLKPYPWAGWKQRERGYVKRWWQKRLKKILNGLAKRGWITPEQLEESKPFQPTFITSPRRYDPPPPAPTEESAPPPVPGDVELL